MNYLLVELIFSRPEHIISIHIYNKKDFCMVVYSTKKEESIRYWHKCTETGNFSVPGGKTEW